MSIDPEPILKDCEREDVKRAVVDFENKVLAFTNGFVCVMEDVSNEPEIDVAPYPVNLSRKLIDAVNGLKHTPESRIASFHFNPRFLLAALDAMNLGAEDVVVRVDLYKYKDGAVMGIGAKKKAAIVMSMRDIYQTFFTPYEKESGEK